MVTYEYDQNGDKVSRDGEGNPNRLKDSMLNYMANVWFGMRNTSLLSDTDNRLPEDESTLLLATLYWVDSWPSRWSCGTK